MNFYIIFLKKCFMGSNERETWNTKLGLVLAMAGNAVGIGNFLRFPVQAASNGGGTFMIPYFIALVFLAIPIMWAEWAMGRLGGSKGHGSVVGIFHVLWKNPIAKYIGILGVVLPLGIIFYYVYIESWTLAYSFFSLTKKYFSLGNFTQMKDFLNNYQGVNSGFGVSLLAYIFFLITFTLNIWILRGGISKGIEVLAKIGMPILFIFSVVLMIKVFSIGAPDPLHPENNVFNGLGFIFNPDFSRIWDAKVWLSAAGQIFFTTSIASGAIHTYASYVKKDDDIALTGFTTVMTNEFVEVIFGASIAIPIAFAFFGFNETLSIAKSGAFNLGFVAMPVIFANIPLGNIFGMIWFFLLFIAAITSSVALTQPLVSFLEDELEMDRRKAVYFSATIIFIASSVVIFGFNHGTVDELDFWIGTFGLSLFAFIEVIIFMWVYGADRAWEEITRGSKMNVPIMFKYILKYLSPLIVFAIFVAWFFQQAPDIITMKNIASDVDKLWRWGARAVIIGFTILMIILVKSSKRLNFGE